MEGHEEAGGSLKVAEVELGSAAQEEPGSGAEEGESSSDEESDMDEEELNNLIALATQEQDHEEREPQKPDNLAGNTSPEGNENPTLKSPPKSGNTDSNEIDSSKNEPSSSDEMNLMLMKEMKLMQQKMMELEKKLKEKGSTTGQQDADGVSGAEVPSTSDEAPARKWTKTPVLPRTAAGPPKYQAKEKPKANSDLSDQKKDHGRKLKDLDVNIFFEDGLKSGSGSSSKKESKKSPPSAKPRKSFETASDFSSMTSAQLFGDDDDSDWEDMDGEKTSNLSSEGRQIKNIIKKKDGARVAHEPKFDTSTYPKPNSSQGDKSAFYAKNKSSLASKTMPQSSSSSSNKSKVDDKKGNDVFAPFTNIRVLKPLIPLTTVRQRMATRTVIKLSKLHQKKKSAAVLEGDWITVGVIVSKSEPKMSSKGKQFSIWTLNDLENLDQQVKFFLFGNVHQQLWKTQYGQVIGILNANMMTSGESKYQNQNSDEVSITVDRPEKVVVIGATRDLGVCKAKTKAGKDCRNAVNLQQGEYCTYHVQAEYKKKSAKRGELQNGFSGVTPKSFEKTLFKKGSDTVFYQGQSFSTSGGSSVAKKQNQVTLKTMGKHQLSNQGVQGKITTASLHKLLPEDAQVLKDLEKEKIEKKSELFHEMLSTPSVGSMNLVKHLMKKEVVSKERKGSEPKLIQSVTAKDLLKMHKQDMLGIRKKSSEPFVSNSRPRTMTPSPTLSGPPQIGRGLKSERNVDLDFDLGFTGPPSLPKMDDKKALALIAKRKAIAKISESGGVKKENPNAVKKRKTLETQKNIEKRLSEDSSEDRATEKDEPPKKRSRLLGGLDLDSDEVQSLLKKKSSHANQLTEQEEEHLEAYFEVLEKKEQMEEKMSKIFKKECSVVTCKKCNYTSFKALDSCKQENHPLKYHKSMMQYFKCAHCGTRTTAFSKYPTEACKGCGKSSFERTSMLREKKGPALPQEQLLLRGEERKYVNS